MRRFNEELAEKLNDYMKINSDMGYRRLNDKARHDEDIQVNDRILVFAEKIRSGQLKRAV